MSAVPDRMLELLSVHPADDAEAAYFDHLLGESVEGYFRGPGHGERDPEAILSGLTDRWRRDFAARFGEHPSHALIFQCERCVRRIRTLRGAFASGSDTAVSASPRIPVTPRVTGSGQEAKNGPRTIPTNRPAETVGRMKIEWSPGQPVATEPEPTPPGGSQPPSRRGGHAARADALNLITGILVLVVLLVLGGFLVLSQNGERARNLKADRQLAEHGAPVAAGGLPDNYAGYTLEQTMGEARALVEQVPRTAPVTGTKPKKPVATSVEAHPVSTQASAPEAKAGSARQGGPLPDLLGMPKSIRGVFAPQGAEETRFQSP